jgi:hypothetical protein
MRERISLEARGGTAIARTSFFFLYSFFKEHRAEDGCVTRARPLVGATEVEPLPARRPVASPATGPGGAITV